MNRNLISLAIEDAQWSAADESITQLESIFIGLIAMEPNQRRAIFKMGSKSESFCRNAIDVLEQNPQVIPQSLSIAQARADLDAIDQLRPRLIRLKRLVSRMIDSEIALGSDVIGAALQGYKLLKVAGRNEGLEGLRSSLGARFKGRPRTKPELGAESGPPEQIED
ncbi:hypothetical protein ACTJIL_03900 [Luteimonas sp. 22616]|uniref:hypothetical protein n=1 Tax=Luteimonas sp. 22616 TaxID=3453951 RepID=UPI003F8688E6